MAISDAIYKIVSFKPEATFGTKPAATDAKSLPRTSFALNLVKNTFRSARIVGHQQAAGTRHGSRRVEGQYQDEVSCGTHKDFWAALLRGTWVDGTTGVSPGKLTVPLVGHTDVSFTVEEWRPDILESQIFLGVKVVQAQVSVQPNGMATVNFTLMGQDQEDPIGAAQYFTTPTELPSNEPASGASGEISIDGSPVALVTQADFTINGNGSVGEVIGSGVSPDVFRGIIEVSGSFTVYHKDKTLLQKYLDEATVTLAIKLDEPGGTEYVKFSMPRVTITSYTMTDTPNGGVTAACQFNADFNAAGANAAAKSIIAIEDTRIATSGGT